MTSEAKRRRSERIEVRATPDERDLIERAVRASGMDLTGFVVSNLKVASQRVLADRTEFALNSADLEAWESINQRPARSLTGLRSLLDRTSPFSVD